MYFLQYKTEITCLDKKQNKYFKVIVPAFDAIIFVDEAHEIPEVVDSTIEMTIEDYKKQGLKIPHPDRHEGEGDEISLMIISLLPNKKLSKKSKRATND